MRSKRITQIATSYYNQSTPCSSALFIEDLRKVALRKVDISRGLGQDPCLYHHSRDFDAPPGNSTLPRQARLFAIPFPLCLNVGTDIVHIPRIFRLVTRSSAGTHNYFNRFIRRILSEQEQAYFLSKFPQYQPHLSQTIPRSSQLLNASNANDIARWKRKGRQHPAALQALVGKKLSSDTSPRGTEDLRCCI
ncbi:mitochondrial phosphopantetheinyl transferase B [Coccidioides immitis RMSCC 3703]|uniref:Mitochondrial phosphopantetheinyl transferase B n=1 Tax=Coccidioides immitis RMSCC 3703 TaxID=454286 RepID=A0A0J8QR98_COCIT|nr:mitochondrial phosphopantetheinyl transferase B [Coccidioides immitis RMSCC 3703]